MGPIEMIDGRPAVSVAWMVSEGLVKLSTLKSLVSRHNIEQARRACRHQKAMVFADNMPLMYRSQIIEKIGDIYEAMETPILDIQHDASAA